MRLFLYNFLFSISVFYPVFCFSATEAEGRSSDEVASASAVSGARVPPTDPEDVPMDGGIAERKRSEKRKERPGSAPLGLSAGVPSTEVVRNQGIRKRHRPGIGADTGGASASGSAAKKAGFSRLSEELLVHISEFLSLDTLGPLLAANRSWRYNQAIQSRFNQFLSKAGIPVPEGTLPCSVFFQIIPCKNTRDYERTPAFIPACMRGFAEGNISQLLVERLWKWILKSINGKAGGTGQAHDVLYQCFREVQVFQQVYTALDLDDTAVMGLVTRSLTTRKSPLDVCLKHAFYYLRTTGSHLNIDLWWITAANRNIWQRIFYSGRNPRPIWAIFLMIGDYYKDHEVDKDHDQVVRAYQAALGITELPAASRALAQYYLGAVYCLGGSGIERDYAKAVMAFQAALEITELPAVNRAQAQYSLGRIYCFGGSGVEKDYAEAVMALQAALEIEELPLRERTRAHCTLGAIYSMRGHEGERDYAKAVTAFQAALGTGVLLEAQKAHVWKSLLWIEAKQAGHSFPPVYNRSQAQAFLLNTEVPEKYRKFVENNLDLLFPLA